MYISASPYLYDIEATDEIPLVRKCLKVQWFWSIRILFAVTICMSESR